MPNLTPIPLSQEEHERLIAIKHKLGVGSWREMLCKLCDIYEELCKGEHAPIPTEETLKPIVEKIVDEKLKNKQTEPQEQKRGGLGEYLKKLGRERREN